MHPTKAFLEGIKQTADAEIKIKNVNLVLTHFMNCRFNKIAKELDNLLGVEHKEFKSFRCRFGKLKEI